MPIKLVSAFDVIDEITEMYHHGHEMFKGHSAGWKALDNIWNVGESELTIITGLPGHRKSAFVDNLSVNLAASQGWGWLTFTPENPSVAYHHRKLMSQYIGLPFSEGFNKRMSKDEMIKATQFIQRYFTTLEAKDYDGRDLVSILGACQLAIDTYPEKLGKAPIKGIILDNWATIEKGKDYRWSEHEYIGKCLTRIIDFVRTRKVHVLLVAHPRKMGVNGDIKAPHPYDISGSAHFFNLPDNCVTIWKESTEHMKVHVRKVKLIERGQCGDAELYFDTVNGCFRDKGQDRSRAGAIRLEKGDRNAKMSMPVLPVVAPEVGSDAKTTVTNRVRTEGSGEPNQERNDGLVSGLKTPDMESESSDEQSPEIPF